MDYEVHKDEMDRLKYSHENEVARLEKHNRRMFWLIIIVFISLILTNAGWILHDGRYQDVVYSENSQDGQGINIIGNGINYGTETGNN